jgi:hypothetical protein
MGRYLALIAAVTAAAALLTIGTIGDAWADTPLRVLLGC